MNKRVRNGILATGLMLSMAQPAEAGPVTDWIKSLFTKEKIEQKAQTREQLVKTLGCDPCKIDEKKPDQRKRDQGRRSSPRSTPRASPPAPDLNKFYYDVGMTQQWCTPGIEANRDYAQIFSSKTGPRQTAAVYHTRLVQRPDTDVRTWEIIRDGTIWGHEIRQAYFKQPDGTYRANIIVDEHLVDKSGKVRAKRGVAFESIVTTDCYKAPEPDCCKEETPEQKDETPADTTDDAPGRRASKPNEVRWTFGAGTGKTTLETVMRTKVGNREVVTPIEKVYDGMKWHAAVERITPNDILAARAAGFSGTDKATEQQIVQDKLSAFSAQGDWQHAFGPYAIKPIAQATVEYKAINFSEQFGAYGTLTELKQDNTYVRGRGGIMLSDSNGNLGNNIKATVGYVWQDINSQRPAGQDRGSAAGDGMIEYGLEGQFYPTEKARIFGDATFMQIKGVEGTERPSFEQGEFRHYRAGADYDIGRHGGVVIGGELYHNQERSKLETGDPLNITQSGFLVNIRF